MSKERFTISLDKATDRDLIDWLNAQDNRSEAVRKALRAYIAMPGVGDLYRQNEGLARRLAALDALGDDVGAVLGHLEAIERKLERGVTLGGCSESDEVEEPDEALASLDKLIDLA
jgi:hypothetical protein